MNTPLFSVIVPIYNKLSYVDDCLSSITDQVDFSLNDGSTEIICIDDGSSDGSGERAADWSEALPFARVIVQRNAGAAAARNTGVRAAHGRYVLFLDCDDVLTSNALSTLRRAVENDACDLVFFAGTTEYETDELARAFPAHAKAYAKKGAYDSAVAGTELFARMHANKDFQVQPCMLITKRTRFATDGLWFHEGMMYEDNAFTIKNVLTAKSAACINDALYTRRMVQGSVMTSPYTCKRLRDACFAAQDVMDVAALHGDATCSTALASEISRMKNQVRVILEKIDDTEREKINELPPHELAIVESFVRPLRLERDNKQLRASRDAADARVASFERSTSFRLGRALTALPRKILHRS